MVNFEVVSLFGRDPDSSIQFNSVTHQKYFNIMLLDFLSNSDSRILGKAMSYLEALENISNSPNFNSDNSLDSLAFSTKEFVNWLDKEILAEKIWLPSIDLETNLSIKRIEFIKICGNISKHNFSCLSGVVCSLVCIFRRNHIEFDQEKALLILDEFYEWFHSDIFNYHSSAIAEFLNNIRWDIFEYLGPEFQKSIVYENNEHPRRYHYTYPKGVINHFAKTCYWDLMNDLRSAPYMRKFQVTRYLKMRY